MKKFSILLCLMALLGCSLTATTASNSTSNIEVNEKSSNRTDLEDESEIDANIKSIIDKVGNLNEADFDLLESYVKNSKKAKNLQAMQASNRSRREVVIPEKANNVKIQVGTPGPSNAEKAIAVEKAKPFEFKALEEVGEFLSKPLKVAKEIAEIFSIPFKRLVHFIGKKFLIGKEALARPIVTSIKLIEKVFVPDACRLRKFCQIGHHLELLRQKVLVLSPAVLEEAETVKAVTDGIIGKECDLVYDNCELVLKPEYEKLREPSPKKDKKENYPKPTDKPKPPNQKPYAQDKKETSGAYKPKAGQQQQQQAPKSTVKFPGVGF